MDYSMILILVVMVAVFYFMIIRPEKKKKKEEENLRNSLKEGDKIVSLVSLSMTPLKIDKILAINSDAQAYKQAGNSVTVPVIKAIGRRIRAADAELYAQESR